MAKEIAEDYASSLADLTVNSKPLINMLTILAEENIEHAGVIVETVEKHLEKVHSDIKLPVLYLVDSIIKNVGSAYIQKFSSSIVNMFTRTFKQVDEKTRSQMFKLRETWHDVFPATKMYQLDVKVNLIDPAWPIQAQPQQSSSIHVNPNFLKKPVATTSTGPVVKDEEQMRVILAKKEQELLMLQKKKIDMELEQTRRQLELAEKQVKKASPGLPVVPPVHQGSMPVATVNPVVPPVPTLLPPVTACSDAPSVPVKQRLGPPVNSGKSVSSARIAPISGAMLAATRRDPRLTRQQVNTNVPPSVPVVPRQQIAPNDFDIKPLERVTKRKNVITIDVNVPEREKTRDPRRRDPRLEKRTKDVDERRRNEKRIRDGERFVKKSIEEKARKLAEKRIIKDEEKREEKRKSEEADNKIDANNFDINTSRSPKTNNVDDYIGQIADAKTVNKLPPIPKIIRHDDPKTKEEIAPSPTKKTKKEIARDKKKKRDANKNDKDSNSSDSLSPEKRSKSKEAKESRKKQKPQMEVDAPTEEEVVAFKELKNYHKERYMRRNKEPSESPEKIPEAPILDVPPAPEIEPSNIPDVVVENKDVDLRVLHPVVVETKAAPVGQKRSSTETVEGKAKKSKLDKFDILFGNEDVDLRQLPQVEETITPTTTESPKRSPKPETTNAESPKMVQSPQASPKQKDWQEVKDSSEEPKKPSKLDLVRAKLAEATKGQDLGKDRLGRPLLFTKSPSLERERRRTISTEDTDLRTETEDEVNKETISLILSQAKEHFKDGKMDKNQYNTLMFQVMQLNEKLKLKEAKQRESLEISKRKLHRAQKVNAENSNPKLSPNHNRFGDVDERIIPPFVETPPNSQEIGAMQDYDMRVGPNEQIDGPINKMIPRPPMPPMFLGPYPPMPMWRGMRPRGDDYGGPRRPRLPIPPFFRNKFDKRPRPPFDRYGPQPAPPKIGTYQGENPLPPYCRGETDPPPLGTPGVIIPPTDLKVIEYVDNDPMKTIEIDGVPREIRFYGETAVIMLDWDDPREIKFLPGARRITFDNKDSVVLKFNEGYEKVEIDDDVFDIRFGAPTRELYINGRWYECFFGGPPSAIIIDGKTRMIQLEGPPPQVDIGKAKRTDLVAGKINLIVDAQHMCPVFLDAKVQKFIVDGRHYTIRFVDSLKTVLINEVPFEVEFGGLPRPIFIGQNKHFIRFSVLPRQVKPGQIKIADMEGKVPEPEVPGVCLETQQETKSNAMETDEELPRPEKVISPDGENSNHGGLDMLASLMPSEMAPASSFSGYSLAEPLFSKTEKIPGLEGQVEETKQSASTTLPILGNINVNDLFAKLVATGIVSVAADKKEEVKDSEKKEPAKPKEDNTVVHPVDLLRPETLRVKQPAIVSKLYGGMQCSGCGARFPPEHTVRYSQHLDWHFRQNRRERDSARRAHSRHWHYDLSDWVQYEEVEDLEEREKSWFETAGAEGEGEGPIEATPTEVPSVPAGLPAEHVCELCGDKFDQFYNEDKEEWHLRKAVRHEDKNYHPLCFEDFKASLAKEEAAPDPSADDVVAIDKTEEPIEIKDTDDIASQSDIDDVVEVLDETRGGEGEEAVEIDEGEEDDVIYKAEPVEEVTVDDEADTDDETQAERRARDEKAEFDYRQIKVKQEPVDPDDEPVITAEEEAIRAKPDTTSTTVLSSIDGNVQLETAAQVAPPIPSGGIRINISKSVPSFVTPLDNAMLDDISVDDEPPPPGEEPELEYTIKDSLKDVTFSRQPPIQKGSELSGLCSIM